jgi:hypothetical protein
VARNRRAFRAYIVADLVERVTDCELGRDFCNWEPVAFEASALERETRGFISITTMRPFSGLTANWMFDPPVSTPISRMTAKGCIAHRLVFAVGQGLGWRNGDRVAGVHAHRVEVFDRADDDAVIGPVAHHLHLEFFPT